MTKLHLVWNEAKSECVGFLDRHDARWTAKGGRHPFVATPTVGEAFREAYAENGERLPETTVELPADDLTQGE